MKKLLIVILAVVFGSSIYSQQTFQIEAFTVDENKPLRFLDIQDLGNGKQVFIGIIHLDGFSKSIIGTINDEGEILETYQLDVSNVVEDDKYLYVYSLIHHSNGDLSILVSVDEKNYLLRLDNDYNEIYAFKIGHSYGLRRDIVADGYNNTYLSTKESDDVYSKLVKIGPNGNTLWSKTIFGLQLYDIAVLSNGNLVCTHKNDDLFNSLGIAVFDSNSGDIIHNKISSSQAINIAIDNSDNIFLYTLRDLSYPTFENDAALIKLDKKLNLLWSRTIFLDNQTYANLSRRFTVDHNNDIVILTYDGNSSGISFLKIDTDGSEIFRRVFLDSKLYDIGQILIVDNSYVAIANMSTNKSRIVRLSSEIQTAECISEDFCTGIEEGNTEIFEGVFLDFIDGGSSLIEIEGFSFNPIQIVSESVCTAALPPTPDFAFENDVFCLGETLVLNEDSVSSLGLSTWEIENESGSNTIISKKLDLELDQIGQWTITHILKLNNCVQSAIEIINVVAPQELDVLEDRYLICDNEPVSIELNADISEILWYDGDNSNPKEFFTSDSFTVSYDDSGGCMHSEDFMVYERLSPSVDLPIDSIPCIGDSYTIIPVHQYADNIFWEDDFSIESRVISETGNYTIIVENECGMSSATHSAEFIDCTPKVYIPNIFSPNNDGINDVFEAFGYYQQIGKCRIYDRWGNMVYQSESEIRWKGDSQGQAVKQGVYAYVIELINDQGEPSLINGTITVIR